jgi:hypothetical protein
MSKRQKTDAPTLDAIVAVFIGETETLQTQESIAAVEFVKKLKEYAPDELKVPAITIPRYQVSFPYIPPWPHDIDKMPAYNKAKTAAALVTNSKIFYPFLSDSPLSARDLPKIVDNSLRILLSSTLCYNKMSDVNTFDVLPDNQNKKYNYETKNGCVTLFMLTTVGDNVEIASVLTIQFNYGTMANGARGLIPYIEIFCANQDMKIRAGWMVKIFIGFFIQCIARKFPILENIVGIQLYAMPGAISWWNNVEHIYAAHTYKFVSTDPQNPNKMEMFLVDTSPAMEVSPLSFAEGPTNVDTTVNPFVLGRSIPKTLPKRKGKRKGKKGGSRKIKKHYQNTSRKRIR